MSPLSLISVEQHQQQALDRAVRRLVDSFSMIPTRWIDDLAQHYQNDLPLPMWGAIFRVIDPCDVRRMEQLCRTIECEDDADLQALRDAGWREIADTGVLAVYFEDELLLGIHGAGYDFYEAHWTPLYLALGYSWHR